MRFFPWMDLVIIAGEFARQDAWKRLASNERCPIICRRNGDRAMIQPPKFVL